jgi:hypothetical protein
MWSVYVLGLRGALRCWPVGLVLFLMSAVFGIAFGSVAWSWLSLALDSSLATRTLLTHLDMNVFVDLLVHHGESLQMLAAAAAVLLGVAGFVWVWLNALAVIAVADPGDWSACVQRAVGAYPTFLRLWVTAGLVTGGTGAGVILAGRAALRWTAESPSEMTSAWILIGFGAVAVLLLLFLATVHDHARIQAVATGAGALRAYLWALAFVGYRSRRALPLAVLLMVTAAALLAVYAALDALVPTTSVPGVVVSLVLGQLMLLARAFVRLWFFAAQTELQNVSDVTELAR